MGRALQANQCIDGHAQPVIFIIYRHNNPEPLLQICFCPNIHVRTGCKRGSSLLVHFFSVLWWRFICVMSDLDELRESMDTFRKELDRVRPAMSSVELNYWKGSRDFHSSMEIANAAPVHRGSIGEARSVALRLNRKLMDALFARSALLRAPQDGESPT